MENNSKALFLLWSVLMNVSQPDDFETLIEPNRWKHFDV